MGSTMALSSICCCMESTSSTCESTSKMGGAIRSRLISIDKFDHAFSPRAGLRFDMPEVSGLCLMSAFFVP